MMLWIFPKRASMRRATLLFAFAVLGSHYQLSGFLHFQEQDKTVEKTNRREVVQRSSSELQETNNIEATVIIHQPVEKVFEFYSDFRNLPRFLGDVMAIEQITPATSRWTIQGPFGIQTHWTTRVTEERPNQLIRYETVTSSPLKTYWEIYFTPGSAAGETEVHEVMKMPLGRLGCVALALLGKFPAEEQSSNLHRLKQLLETGTVTDTSYSVRGKFTEDRKRRE
jgi:uncharacterized membrane protein